MRWAGHIAGMGKRRGTQSGLARKPQGKRALGRPRSGSEDNIKMDLREMRRGT